MAQHIFHLKIIFIILLTTVSITLSTNVWPEEQQGDTSQDDESLVEEVIIWGKSSSAKDTDKSNPNSILNPEDMVSINAATTEDLVKYEPSLVIRRRFIGDSNGTMGMRGSNMFQTSRSMVFADGVPLHYFLQTRWSGSPRWSLVSADEIAQIEVIYGPYSAEYSGNAMGGVVKIETAIPTERRFHLDGSLFNQSYDELGFDENLSGHKGFISYGDKFGNLSLYTSYNRLENDSQPQNFRFDRTTGAPEGGETDVNGAIFGKDEYGNAVPYFADSGKVNAATDHLKLKIGYEMDKWFALLNIAYENRDSITDSPNNYLLDASGQPVWNGSVVQDGVAFGIRRSNFAVSESDRQTLLIGGRLQGELSSDWWLEANASVFRILEDEDRDSNANPLDPAYTIAGEVSDYEDTGWKTAEIKIQNDRFLSNKNLSFVSGLRYESYSLEINNYDSDNYQAGWKTTLTNSSGGKSSMLAGFSQLVWRINDQWGTIFGGRYESWKSKDGFYGDVNHIDRSESRFSPKFSSSYTPNEDWQFRLSLAKAYRFPIVEELFQNERRTLGTSLANANLEPEDGLHQNLMLERALGDGYFRFNFFHETIDDVIFAQTTIVDNTSLNTFIPIDEVETSGIEFVVNQNNLIDTNMDIRFNLAYTDSEITKNNANIALEGKRFPRIPKWRANLLMTYHISDQWDFGGGVRYSSNSFGDLDNRDTESNVFGSHDSFTFLNLKSSYQINDNLKLSVGIDNVSNDITFVHHPWPGRTMYLETSVDF